MPARNGSPRPSAEHLAGIADLAQALGTGSAKFCEALLLVFGKNDQKYRRADRIDQQLQPLVAELNHSANHPPPGPA